MTLKEKILKTFVVTIRDINAHGGPEEFFKKYPVGGLFYREFYDGPYNENGNEIGTGFSREKFELCKKYAPDDMLVCADVVAIEGQMDIGADERVLSAADCDELSYNWGKSIGMQCNSQGVDWILAPCMDMYFSNCMPLMAITDDPKLTARIYRNVVRGIQDQGVCATVKHFPGLGTDSLNMHYAPGRNILPFDKWMDTYGYTYKEVFKESPACVMNTHTALRSYDNDFTDGYFPVATFSKKLNVDLLRDTLGFKGAIITDALIMGGSAVGNSAEEAAQAFKCGADFLLWPPIEAADRIEELILSGEIPMSRLDEALERIEALKNMRREAIKNKVADEPSADFVNDTLKNLVSKAICNLRNERNLLPIDTGKYKNILLIDASTQDKEANFNNNRSMAKDEGDSQVDISVKLLMAELEKEDLNVKVVRGIHDVGSRVCWQPDADMLQEGQDLVIFNVRGNYLSNWNNTFMSIWGSHMYDKAKKVIIIYGSPFFAPECFPEDPTIIEMNCEPTPYSVSELAKKLLGKSKFEGKTVLHHLKDGVLNV